MERLGDTVKREVSNAIWETLGAIEKKMTGVLCPCWESTERVHAFLGDNWLPQAVVTFLDQLQRKNRLNIN